jgi:hypothetical protein
MLVKLAESSLTAKCRYGMTSSTVKEIAISYIIKFGLCADA